MSAAGIVAVSGVGVCVAVAVVGAAAGSTHVVLVGIAGLLYTLWRLTR